MLSAYEPNIVTTTPKIQDFVILSKQNQELTKLVGLYRAQEHIYKQQLMDQVKRSQKLQNENQEYRVNIHQLKKRVNYFEEIREQLFLQYQCLRKEISSLKQKQAEKKGAERSKELDHALNRIRQELEEVRAENSTKDSTISLLKDDNAQLRKQLTRLQIQFFEFELSTNNTTHHESRSHNSPRKHPKKLPKPQIYSNSAKKAINRKNVGKSKTANQSFV